MSVYKTINAVQADLAKAGIGKDSTNTFDNYKFRGIDAVYNALAPLLAKHGLCILPRMLTRTVDERTSAKGGALFYVTVEAEFDFVCAEDGSKHTIRTFGEAMDRGDKATNKAMSAAYKYAAFQAFAIPTEGDNDADANTHEVAAKPARRAPVIPATAKAEGMTPQRSKEIENAAVLAIRRFNAGDEVGAYEEVSGITDTEEKLFLWNSLHAHSALRASLKKMAQADKEAIA